MLKKFATKELVFLALMAALLLVVNLLVGAWLIVITGIPAANTFVTGFTFGLFLLLVLKTLPKFGALTLLFFLYSVLTLPTILGGGPGFWPAIIVNTLTGLSADLFLGFTKYKRWSYFSGFYILAIVNLLLGVFFLYLLGIPGWDQLLAILWWVLPLYFVLGTAGILFGEFIFKRIKDKKVMKQFQN